MRLRRLGLLCSTMYAGPACTSTEKSIGAFEVRWSDEGAKIEIGHPDGFSIETGPDAFASATFQESSDMQFGSFLFQEREIQPYSAADAIDGWNDDDALILTKDGDEVGTVAFAPHGAGLGIRLEMNDGNRSRLRVTCDDGPFLGFGAQTHDVDHRGQKVPVFVSEQGIGKVDDDTPSDAWVLVGTRHQSYLSVPTMVAPRAKASYGVHATTFHRSTWDLCKSDPRVLEVAAGESSLELVFFPGPTPTSVLEQLSAEVGRALPAPDWVYGVWVEKVGGQAAVLEEARALREAHIPVSAIWSEDLRGAKQSGNEYILEEDWRPDAALYPDAAGMIASLDQMGIAFQAYYNTFVVSNADVAPEVREQGLLVRTPRGEPLEFSSPSFEPSGLLDLFLESGFAFVRQELQAATDLGIRGWMADYAEWYPEDPTTVAPSDGSAAGAAHHRYPVEWARVNAEVLREASDAVVYHRSGYTGSQGLTQVIWAGDQRTSFQPDDGLPTVVPIMLGLSMTGFPVVTHDIGGYASATNPPTTKELFFRWTQLGAFSPVMRTHHGRNAYQNWRWSSDAETTEHFRFWADVHTRLFPLWKGLGIAARSKGTPMLRPLAFQFPQESRLSGVKDSYLIGEGLLVAPVLEAGRTERLVLLPEGRWYELDWHDPVRVVRALESDATAAAPLGHIPTFARAGTLLPLLPPDVETLRTSPDVRDLSDIGDQRELLVFLGAPGRVPSENGGEMVLDSSRTPRTVGVESGATIESEGEGFLVVSVSSDVVQLVDEANTTHTLRLGTLSEPLRARIFY